jgi:hypothetical protein
MERTMQLQFSEIRDKRQKEWFWLDNALLDEYARLIGPNAVLVYIALSRHADNDEQTCWPSMETIAEEIGIKSRNTVAKGIKTLQKFGMIEVQQSKKVDGTHNNNVYTLLSKKHWKDAEEGVLLARKVLEKPVVLKQGDSVQISMQVTEHPQPEAAEMASHCPWLNKEAWDEWVVYRKEIKKKLTPTTIKQQLKFLEEHQADHVAIITQSIQNGWTGLFPFKGKKAPANRQAAPAGKYAHVGQKI